MSSQESSTTSRWMSSDAGGPDAFSRPARGSRALVAAACAGTLLLAVLAVAHTVARAPGDGTMAMTVDAPSALADAPSATVALQDAAPAVGSRPVVSASPDAVAPRAVPAPVSAVPPSPAGAPRAAEVSPVTDTLSWKKVATSCRPGTSASVAADGKASCRPSTVLALVGTAPTADAGASRATANDGGTRQANGGATSVLGATPMAFSARALDLDVSLSPHPRLILDTATLAGMRQRAAANSPQWKALKSVCDGFIGGSVQLPGGNGYPDRPNVGPGYQGSDYIPALLSEGMCYQVLKSSDPTTARKYGDKAREILLAMSTPGSQGQDPCTDSGYGIRFYGVGFGLGYDWAYDLLKAADQEQVYTTANAWIDAWEKPNGCADFEYEHPQSNYFAGYFHAKAVIALATYGENPAAPAQWEDWLENQFGKRVQPFYQKHLAGGGWPEGYANYAPLGILNMSLPAREVKTATGLDLVHGTAPYTFPVDNANYSMHFTWPSRAYFDDRDTNRSASSSQPPGTTQVGMFQQILGAVSYWEPAQAPVFRQYLSEVDKATSGYGTADAWLRFLVEDTSGEVKPVSTLPRSYFAPGLGAVAARSDWGTSASWMSFRAAAYANNPGQGEEYFDQGSLALVRGDTPLLVNAGGWMVHNPNGTAAEDGIYTDNYGSFSANNVYQGNRQASNIYYVRNMSGSSLAEPFGQAAFTLEDQGASTKVAAYEDGGGYVYVLATGLEDMYRRFRAGAAVASWSRQIVYLRPNRFVVYDRTTSGSAGYDQYLAWHFPANPVASSSGLPRLDVTFGGKYVGAMTTVLPANAAVTTTAIYPSSNPVKVWQTQVRAPDTGTSQRWLTVFDLSSTSSAVATAKPVTVTQGSIVGVTLAASDGNSVVVSGSGAAGSTVGGTIGYTTTALSGHHVVTDLPPHAGYSISASGSGSTLNVTISPGGTWMSSAKGVLDFIIDAGGEVQDPPTISTLPVGTSPVPGFPRPYSR